MSEVERLLAYGVPGAVLLLIGAATILWERRRKRRRQQKWLDSPDPVAWLDEPDMFRPRRHDGWVPPDERGASTVEYGLLAAAVAVVVAASAVALGEVTKDGLDRTRSRIASCAASTTACR